MNKKLWEASSKLKSASKLFKFENFISNRYNINFNNDYEKIHNWSIKYPQNFWTSVWDFSKIKGEKNIVKLKKSPKFYKNIHLLQITL